MVNTKKQTVVLSHKSWLWWLVHVAIPLLFGVAAIVGAIYRLYTFTADDGDYGLFSNIIWNFSEGRGWQVSQYFGEVRFNFLADHFALIVPLLAPIMYLFPSPYTLSVLHGISFLAVFLLVPFLVKEIWKEHGRDDYLKAALFLLCALYFFKGYASAWRYQTHMTTLVTPFLLASLIALHRRRLWWAAFWCFLVALAQERAVVAVCGVGMYAFLITGQRRFGVGLCAIASTYFLAIVKIFIPSFYDATRGYMYSSHIAPLQDFSRKMQYLVNMYAYWFLLPLAGRKAFMASLCAMPVIGIGLVSNRAGMYGFSHQYQDLPSMFFLAAAAYGVFWLQQQPSVQRLPKALVPIIACVLLIYSAKVSRHNSSWQNLVRWNISEDVVQLHEELKPFYSLPPEIALYTLGKPGPHLALRDKRYRFTPEQAGQPFSKSVILLTHDKSQYPYTLEQLQPALEKNPTLVIVHDSAALRVYASTDIAKEYQK